MTRRLFAGAFALMALVFIALGVWQIERRTWKLRLIAEVSARIHAPPAALETWNGIGPADAYRRVTVRGVLLRDHQTLVQAVTELGPGWWVITPLRTGTGTILINRGFIPPERRDQLDCPGAALSGPVAITGLIRITEPHGGFLRANDPAEGRWYSRDVRAIGAARGVQALAPVFIDAEAAPTPCGYPIGGLTVVAFHNSHLVYALTWFALAGLCVYGSVMLIRRWGSP